MAAQQGLSSVEDRVTRACAVLMQEVSAENTRREYQTLNILVYGLYSHPSPR